MCDCVNRYKWWEYIAAWWSCHWLAKVSSLSTSTCDHGNPFFARSVLFQNERDVREVGITFIGQPVDWDSKEAHDLVEIVKPSSKQINFSIGEQLKSSWAEQLTCAVVDLDCSFLAHEVAHIQYLDFVLQAMLLSASLLASCWLARLTHLGKENLS